MTKKSASSVSVDSTLFVKVIYPDILYSVQNQLKEHGVDFIDLNNGEIVNGNINIDTLGMIVKKKVKKEKKSKGNATHFLLPPLEKKKIFDIEATINIYQPQSENDPTIFTVQVIDENNLKFWQRVFIDIGKAYLSQRASGEINPEAIFHLIPLTLPDPSDPKSAIQAMRGNIQRYSASSQNSLNLSSGLYYPEDEEFFDEEELNP